MKGQNSQLSEGFNQVKTENRRLSLENKRLQNTAKTVGKFLEQDAPAMKRLETFAEKEKSMGKLPSNNVQNLVSEQLQKGAMQKLPTAKVEKLPLENTQGASLSR
ncbi:hypothetical protein [Peribacillus frigoritolerans]|uniref:hypothetical protein n=1 Tax=Peribacillus frigoritolerans TaxID=450367 RepID=UPI0020795D4D|nr:hypothetical protein [Peribacillus frigoritolerans]USK77782.1 hypothetical protein LIT31_26000 [Peribacillus frigoritolerans]